MEVPKKPPLYSPNFTSRFISAFSFQASLKVYENNFWCMPQIYLKKVDHINITSHAPSDFR